MNFSSLDNYSIRQIFFYLDIRSHVNLRCTCKRMALIGLDAFNKYSMEQDLQKKLIVFLFDSYDRDDVIASTKYQRHVSFVLNSLHSPVQQEEADVDHEQENLALHELKEDLKSYIVLSHRRVFAEMLAKLAPTVCRALNVFDYGELLAYLPLVKALLNDIRIEGENTVQSKKYSLQLGKHQSMKITLKKEPTPTLFAGEFVINDGDVSKMVSILFEEEEEERLKALSLFVDFFEKYIEKNFTLEEQKYVPEISMRFLEHFCSTLI